MRTPVCLGVSLAIAAASPAAAQGTAASAETRARIENCRQSESVILRIEACTRLIGSEDRGGANPAWAFTNRALAYETVGRVERAFSDYNTALLLDPGFAVGYYNRGNLNARMGNIEAAIDDHSQAVELAPDYVEAWFNLAKDHEDDGDLEAAVEAYGRALEVDPSFTAALTSRAAALCELGRVEASIADRLQLLNTGFFSARDLQQFLKERGYYSAALDGIFGRGSRAALRAWTEAGCPRG